MDNKRLGRDINFFWDEYIIPALVDYIKIPNKSPVFEPDWESKGHMDSVLNLAVKLSLIHI